MKLVASTTNPPIGAVLTLAYVSEKNVSLEWGKETLLQISETLSLDVPTDISRYLAKQVSDISTKNLDPLLKTEIDHWLSFSLGVLSSSHKFNAAIKHLDTVLASSTYLVGSKISIADLNVFGALHNNSNFEKLENLGAHNTKKWYNHIASIPTINQAIKKFPHEKSKPKSEVKNEPKEEGKFVDLPGAEMGKVVVRFPPEASGFLHIGHAKAALLNWHYKELFNGTLVMRFDDTNPDKEKADFEKVILEDLKMLQIYPDKFTHTSQYFPLLLELCERLLRSGQAYVDDTPPEQMKTEREARQPSLNRSNTVDKNFSMWTEMVNGTDFGQKCCVRAKIDMTSDNGCMRDPTIYRFKNEPHPTTKSLYKVYPTYDFACPVVDSVEGITHALRTMEYHDRDEQYYWFIDALKLRKPYIWEYSRLNMMNTVLSKRKLTWFVEQGLVESWEDPRFPTVRGVLRRGMTVQGLKQFIIAQGSSRSVVQMEWDKIWAFNKKVIDPVAPRYTALEASSTVPVNVEGAKGGNLTVPKHPKNDQIGTKTVPIGPRVLIAAEDAQLLKEGENTTFINWGNLLIKKIHRGSSGTVEAVDASLNLDNTDFKKTLKLTWLADKPDLSKIDVLFYDHIITKPVLARDEDFKLYINKNSKKTVQYIGDAELGKLKADDIIQLQRIGYFRVDVPATDGKSVVLIHIPDGSSKSPVTSSEKKTSSTANKPLTNKELEQIAVQWRNDRECTPSNNTVINGTCGSSLDISNQIKLQGEKVRQLKTDKASKSDIDVAVKQLLSLKQEFKAATGSEWKPGTSEPPQAAATKAVPLNSSLDLSSQIAEQGNNVRDLKTNKANKADIDSAVKILLALKQEYKSKTGQEWKPSASPVPSTTSTQPSASQLSLQIQGRGDKVRELKASKAAKNDIDSAVKELLALKQDYKKATGQDWKPSPQVSAPAATSPVTISSSNSLFDKVSEQGNRVRESPQVTAAATPSPVASNPVPSNFLFDKVTEQGNKIRELKSSKANKADIDAAVKVLLSLKSEYQAATGQEWKPSPQVTAAAAPSPVASNPVPSNFLFDKVTEQGNKIRELKSSKANKADIDAAVKVLLSLKSEYQTATGQEWKPSPQVTAAATPSPVARNPVPSNFLFDKVTEQGNKIRELKSSKANKADIDAAVKVLLSLKSEYQAATGQEWKPGVTPAPLPAQNKTTSPPPSQIASPSQLSDQITQQGNLVRQLKSQKASKSDIDDAVKVLLTLKLNYKNSTCKDWQPAPTMATAQQNNPVSVPDVAKNNDISNKITAQGDKVRDLKTAKADKAIIEAEVKTLLALKAEYKSINGTDWKPPGGATQRATTEKKPAEKKPKTEKKDKEKSVEKDDEKSGKKQTRLGLEARKEENLPDWYSQVITKGELIEYYDVSGCYILRPWSFAVWEAIQGFLDKEIKKLGVVNAYFPMFVSRSVLEREKAHIADFAPEVAWVTKSGDSELAEPIAIRPTSETAMYPAYAKWIQSHRDLPLRLNQWNNVVRWEFKHPQPFLRTREFLWQEGHTAFATYKEAETEVYQILELYKQVYTDLLAIPVIKGRKTEKEKFAGGDYTTTVEAFISASGRAIQGATSHHLGHNFSKMFDITVEDPETKEKMYVFQNSWGITTRTIGVMIMVHADNKGLVLPPAVAALQVVIVPCGISASLPEHDRIHLNNSCKKLDDEFRSAGLRSKLDERDNYSTGWKFNDWELKGVPLRVELGPKDLEKNQLVAVRRDDGTKTTVPLSHAASEIRKLLDTIQAALYSAAENDLKEHTKVVTKWDDFCTALDAKNIILSPFCEAINCEENIKKDSARDRDLDPGAPAMGAKSLCIPFDQPTQIKPGDKCIHPSCSSPPKSYTLFGRSY